jgi:hypothetical protein
MAIPTSSISIACEAVVKFVDLGLNAGAHGITVSMGAPSAIKDDVNRVNLFFYRFEPFAFQAGTEPKDIWRVSIHCLITVYGEDDQESSAGEKELRMLGQVIRIFREKPILNEVNINNEPTRLQALFKPVTDEQLNQIWSIQGDAAYRPSVVYELALAPVIPSKRRVDPQRVGESGFDVRADMSARHDTPHPAFAAPIVPLSRVNTLDPGWAPHICWVNNKQCEQTLSFDVESPEFNGFKPNLWIAGDPGADISLSWEVWDKTSGWKPSGAAIAETPFNEFIDPENIPATRANIFPVELDMPVTLPAGPGAAQALLYASRVVTIEGQQPRTVRSNPLLISIYRSA